MAGAAGVGAATILHWPANAAEFSYKLGSSSPMEHPAMAAQQEAADKIKQESNGRLEITIYPNSVLGGDTAMIAQVDLRRDGDVQPADRSAGAAQSGLRHVRRRFRLPRL